MTKILSVIMNSRLPVRVPGITGGALLRVLSNLDHAVRYLDRQRAGRHRHGKRKLFYTSKD